MTPSFIQLDKPAIWGPPRLSTPIVSHYQLLINFNLLKRSQLYTLLPISVTTTTLAKLWWSLAWTMKQTHNWSTISTPLWCGFFPIFSPYKVSFVCLFQILQWFPFALRMTSNLLNMSYKTLNYLTPKYLSILLHTILSLTLSLSVTLTFFISQDMVD